MRYTKISWMIIILTLSLVLSACNLGQEPEPTPDVGAIFTAAAETVMAQFSLELTLTAQAAPTVTPIPTNTPAATFAIENPGAGSPATTPIATLGIGTQPTTIITLPTITPAAALGTPAGPACMNSAFIQDITYADGSEVKRKQYIEKIWRVQNTGTCTWDDGFSLQPVTGESLGGKAWIIDEKKEFVKPGEIVDIGVDLYTGEKRGEHGGCWRMKGDNDYYFGTFLCILITVY